MGGFNPGVVRLCFVVACLLAIVDSAGRSPANSEVDTDLIFDNLDQTNISTKENYHRKERSLVQEGEDSYWLTGAVKRIKRSISHLFSRSEEENKVHKKIKELHYKKAHAKTIDVPKKRKHRQAQDQDEYDDVPSNSPDDEDNLIVSGDGSGNVEVPETTTDTPIFHQHRRVYRFIITLMEAYLNEYNDRNSPAFQDLAGRIKRSIEEVYNNVPGEQLATVISIQEGRDAFKVRATVDVDSNWHNNQVIRSALFDLITDKHRLGNLTAFPEDFSFQEFGDSVNKCTPDELSCKSGQCVPSNKRCDGIRDCNDNSDEEGCVDEEIVHRVTYAPQEIPVTEAITTALPTDDLGEGSGEDCRADDSVRCADGSRTICADQQCDGIPDCADGADERDCPGKNETTTETECAVGEFKCDVTRCIPVSQLCDNRSDCSDGSDEHNCPAVCSAEEFSCDQKCIPTAQRCDGNPDCNDNSDEAECPEPQRCRSGEFSCGDGRCIPEYSRCDGRNDCRNGNDERNCTRPEIRRCRADQFSCQNGKCIPISKKCDRQYDCDDNSDEKNCPCLSTDFHCYNGFCIPQSQRCNGVHNCQDGSDEIGCTTHCLPHEWKCNEGTCIDQMYRCNMLANCPDRSDEVGCNTCSPDQFRCSDGTCLSLSKICDNVSDCRHSEDEESCASCKQDEFRCTNGDCVDENTRCDGHYDCTDKSDEQNCNGPTVNCPEGEFQCAAGFCIMGYKRCNGYNDCPSGNDEENCPRTTESPETACSTNEFRCHNGICIHKSYHCDGLPDCFDNSDEINCETMVHACEETQFDCGNRCIDRSFRCDDIQDCDDGRDELDCECTSDQFQCADRTCIPSTDRCNGVSDCGDNSDEQDCKSVTPAPTPCSSNELRCGDGSCIPLYMQCDGRRDCPDGTDEDGCPCRPTQFQCLNTGQCIDANLRCNRQNECSDGSDEYNCPTLPPPVSSEPTPSEISCPYGQRPCSSRDQCIRNDQHCDGRVDCHDESDESNCRTLPEQISCPYGYQPCRSRNQCIRTDQLCDGRVDCNDMSDETNCPGSSDGLDLRTYPDAQDQKERQEVVYTCRDEGLLRVPVKWERPNGQSLPIGSRDNNGRLEIPSIRMEDAGTYLCVASGYPPQAPGAQRSVQLRVIKRPIHPTPRPPTACGLYEATCSNGDCISKSKVCDGVFDCADGSDENRCNPNGCEPNEFQCTNKKCILKTWRCDSDDDCGDGSDEEGCATNPPNSFCQYHQFACHSNNQCIPKSYHCDMERDCVDGSDEIGCAKPVISKPPPPMVKLHIGELFVITCTAVGIPTPLISWRLNWGHIPSNCRATSENGVGTLTCENIQVTNQGAYSCEALNIKGATFAHPDTILVVEEENVCRPGYFNVQARTEGECIKCFCFGQATSCRSADLFIFQFQPPFDSLKLLGVRIDPAQGVVDVRDEPIYRGAQPELNQVGAKGVHASVPDYSELNQPNVIPYFAMPENYHGNQLKSYGGYLRYTVKHSNRGYPTPGPSVIISGNNYILLHQSNRSPDPNSAENMEVRFFEGEWLRKSSNAPEALATREEIMMVLEDIDNILIKLQYNEGTLNTTITNIEMDSAAIPDGGLGPASYVEECSCPSGYAGYSCERCADGYIRHKTGPWLGQCLREPKRCAPGQYNDGRDCQNCPCPHTNPSNQFGRTCHLGSDGDVICDCPPGYVGNRCQQCAPGYSGNPLIPGDSCKPFAPPEPYCDLQGSSDARPDAYGRCRCKNLVDGPTCNQCKANTFYLSNKNQFGCISCFCMGVSDQCSTSNWYRDKISTVFTSSVHDFGLVDTADRASLITEGIHLRQENREIAFGNFNSPNAYYWTLPSRYLGDKITSYGGYLRYTLRHTPVPGGQSSRNSAADVELTSKNNINLQFYNRNQSQPSSAPQTFTVPLLEQYWQRSDGQPADREHLLMVLADLEGIYIKATYYTNTKESSLISVELDVANERNTGSYERALEVEQCHCPVGYTGLSCEDCAVGYTRTTDGIYLGLCEQCSCNGHSNECDAESGICINCRDHTTGDNCEECLPGYSGDPTNGVPCAYQGTPLPCNCDPRGSVSSECRNGACTCKVNVEGNNCNRCRSGTFGLNVSNIEGCEECFCSGSASECSESNLYIEQIPIQIDDEHRFTLTDQQHRERISDNFNVDMFNNDISYTFPPGQRETLYWSLPSTFTGNKVKSYGGKLEYTQRYTQHPSGRYVPDRDIIIIGNGVTLYWSNPIEQRENTINLVSVPLHPSNQWFRLEEGYGRSPASRQDLLLALANLESILIRATQSSDTSTAHLSDITLDTAVDTFTGQPRASQVEVCRCLQGFRGTSCESCASGFYKDLYFDSSRPLGSCARCPCNSREESCEMDNDRRVLCHCRPGYSGRNCEFEAGVTTTPYPETRPTPGKPTIDITIEDHNIGIFEVGSTVRYNCSARSHFAPRTIRVHWAKDGGDLPSRAVDDERGLLVITDLQVQDSGRYICEATDGYSFVTSSVTLNVGVKEDENPRIALSQPLVEVNEGEIIEVRCAASGVPTPELRLFRQDRQPLNPRNFDNAVFRVEHAQISDSGIYQCIATNRAGSDSARFQVIVHESVEPIVKVNIQPQSYSGNTGDTVVLRCVGSGNIQSIRWTKQGGDLPYDSREDRGQLMISNATPDGSGTYICTVTTSTSTGGTSRGSSKATVTISGSDVGKFPTAKVSPEKVTISQGQTTELQCTVTGFPAPSVKWTKLSGVLGVDSEQVGSVLYVRNARVEDRGVYICVATNANGIAQGSVVVEVTRLETPRIDIYPQTSQTVLSGESTNVQCRVIAGYPSPTITWSRSNFLPLSPNIEEMSGGVLRFMQITPEEEGEYICTAANDAGIASASAHIIVHIPPQIQISPPQQNIQKNVGDDLRLECQASGKPDPTVVWTKYGYSDLRYGEVNAHALQNIAIQEFYKLTKQDEGIYICRATSIAGFEETRVRLIVDPLPSRGDITGEDATSTGLGPRWKDNEPRYPPTDVSPNEELEAAVGARAEIRCRTDNPEVSFMKWARADNRTLPPEAYETNGTLHFDNIQPSAEGVYRCLGYDRSTGRNVLVLNTYLRVLFPPRITLIPARQVVSPGDNAYVNCTTAGAQPITITWSPLGRSMPAGVYTREGYLRFNNIQREDAGRYICRAQNSDGSAESVSEVIVQEKVFRPVITAERKQQQAAVGSSVELRCNSRNSNARNTIHWIRENLPLPVNSRVRDGVLYIPYVQYADSGRYYCEVNTKEGISSDYVDLEATRPESEPEPTLTIYPSENRYAVDSIVDIVCRSSERGVIPVWTKLSEYPDNDNVLIDGGRLRIERMRPTNAGEYRCEATGRRGTYHKDLTLEAIEEYEDEPMLEIKSAPRGSTVLLECKVDLEEPVTYLWSKQGSSLPNYIDIYSRTIQLNDVGSSEADTYTCSASSGTKNLKVPIILVVTGIVPYFTQAPNSYVTLPTLNDAYMQFSFEISFKPENGNGLILYNGHSGSDKNGDFISLSLVNSIPEFKFNLGSGPTTLVSDHPLTNGQWHTVKIVRNRKKVTMFVDGEGPYISIADGRYIGLDLTEHLYIGGVPDPNNISPEVFGYNRYVGFVGCISRLKIGHSHQDILREALNKTSVTTCEICTENKCENKGACQEALSKEGYTCICPSGFSGPTCNKLKGEACSPYACGVGRCVDTENSFECQCPFGRAGRRCEREITINEPAFQNDAYIAYPTPKPVRNMKITLKIKPNSLEDGVLLYCSETEEGHGDFVSLSVHDKHLEFRFDAGNGPTIIRHNEELVPGQWHILTASRSLSEGRLLVDGKTPTIGHLKGNRKTLNLQTPLYVGGYDKHHIKPNDGVKVLSGFNGCISDISVSGLDINIIQNATDASNVEDCSNVDDDSDVDNNIYSSENDNRRPVSYDHKQTGCSSDPCRNGGQCYPLTPTEYKCSCLPGFNGKTCETAVEICEERPCQNQGICKGNNTHYTCDCILGFTGFNCEQMTELHNDAHFEGNGYLEFSRDLLNHEDKYKQELIALELSTNSSNGLIFWHGQTPNEDGQGQDYISLSLQNGFLEFSYDLGAGPAIIRDRTARIDDGERHRVVLKREGRDGSMEIDDFGAVEGHAQGFTNKMNCAGNIYLGGAPDVTRMTGGRFTSGFEGCVHGFELQDSQRLDVGVKAIGGVNVRPCSSFVDPFDNLIH